MTIPKEAIWQELRTEALSTIPPGSRAPIGIDNSLTRWYRRGYFVVNSATKTGFELTTATVDVGSALLADIEHLLDSAAEHQVSLWRHVNTAVWLSPAWMAVTFYYWAYFLCLAMTRLIGQTVWFLDKPAVRALVTMASAPSQSPGAGCFALTCGPVVSLNDRDLILRKTGGRLHDELWTQWSRVCESKLNRLAAGSSTSSEERLFAALVRTGKVLGSDWQSAFRNAVNYRPAFAYSAVRRDRVLASLAYLRSPATYDFDVLLDRFESKVCVVTGASTVAEHPQVVAELLVYYTFLLHAMTEALYAEVLDRHNLDQRWAKSRLTFLKNNNIYSAGEPWPC